MSVGSKGFRGSAIHDVGAGQDLGASHLYLQL